MNKYQFLSYLAFIILLGFCVQKNYEYYSKEDKTESIEKIDLKIFSPWKEDWDESENSFGSTQSEFKLYERDAIKVLSQDIVYSSLNGEAEKTAPDGSRVDILTESGYAAEVEWASKWKESIGQALFYSIAFDAKPMIILIMESKKDDRYYLRALTVASKYNIKIVVVSKQDLEVKFIAEYQDK